MCSTVKNLIASAPIFFRSRISFVDVWIHFHLAYYQFYFIAAATLHRTLQVEFILARYADAVAAIHVAVRLEMRSAASAASCLDKEEVGIVLQRTHYSTEGRRRSEDGRDLDNSQERLT